MGEEILKINVIAEDTGARTLMLANSSSQPTSSGGRNIKDLYQGGGGGEEEGGLCKLEFTGPNRPSCANELLL